MDLRINKKTETGKVLLYKKVEKLSGTWMGVKSQKGRLLFEQKQYTRTQSSRYGGFESSFLTLLFSLET